MFLLAPVTVSVLLLVLYKLIFLFCLVSNLFSGLLVFPFALEFIAVIIAIGLAIVALLNKVFFATGATGPAVLALMATAIFAGIFLY